ncbi:MAG: CHASE domain-containing protein [Verrucomicrobia bacterium]|nr:CHASE domain-containing protein [Verrucomicrobiota bacterium]
MQNGSRSVGENWRRWAPAYIVLLVAVTATLALYLLLDSQVKTREQRRFEETAQAVFKSAELHLDYHLELLKGIRALFFANERFSRDDWRRFFNTFGLGERHPGIIDVGYVLRVPAAELDSHVAAVRQKDLPGYFVYPAGNRPEYYPLIYLRDAVTGDPGPVGWDFATNPERWDAMERARDTGAPNSTGKIWVDIADQPSELAFIVYLPVYRGGVTPVTVEARRTALQGFVFASMRPSKLWKGAANLGAEPTVDLEIFDGRETSRRNLLYDDDGVFHSEIQAHFSGPIHGDALGRAWTFYFSTLAAFSAESRMRLPMNALVIGLVLSAFLFAIACLQARARAASEDLALELRRSEENLRRTNRELESRMAERQQAERSLVESRTRLTLLNTVLGCMAAGCRATEMIARTIRRISELFPAFGVCYSTIDLSGTLTVISSSEPPGWPSLRGTTVDISVAPEYLTALRRRTAFVVSDVTADDRLKPLGPSFAALGNRAILDLPLKQSGTELGLLCLRRPEPHEWSEHEIVTLEEVAEHLCIAFKHEEMEERRKQAEASLISEKELLSVTLRSIEEGVITTDADGKVLLLNRAAEGFTAWRMSDAVGRPLIEVFDIVDPKTRERLGNPVENVLKTGEIFGVSLEGVLIARDETERVVAAGSAPIFGAENRLIGAVLVFLDVTERQKLEAEMLKAGKIESLGLMAGGIAHDFNNILTGILGNVSLAKIFAPEARELQARLDQAEKACLRARDLTQQLLSFAKGGHVLKRIASAAQLIEQAMNLALRGSNVRSEVTCEPGLWPVEVDPSQIKQVINNLVLNATEAMPEGGIVKVRAENQTVSLQSALPLPAGRYVRIVIEDQGIGLKPEHLAKIFDPNFSSKQQGSGLGLATAYLIVKKHGGLILAESELGIGTRFQMYLPVSRQRVETDVAPASAPGLGSGRILVMDDDESVRELAAAVLQRLGCEVELVKDGVETVRRYSEAMRGSTPFAAVILDLTVPGAMGAMEAVRQLTAIDPNVKAIVSSGYSTDPVMTDFTRHGFCGCVHKPYRLEELAKVLRQVVRQDASGG